MSIYHTGLNWCHLCLGYDYVRIVILYCDFFLIQVMLLMSLNILLLCTQGWPMSMACTLHMAGKFPNEKYVGGFFAKNE